MKRRSLLQGLIAGAASTAALVVPEGKAQATLPALPAHTPAPPELPLGTVHFVQTSRREVLAQVVGGSDIEGIILRYETRPAEGNILHQQTVIHPVYHRPTLDARPQPGSWHHAIDPVDGYVCPCARPYADKGYRRIGKFNTGELVYLERDENDGVPYYRIEMQDEKFGDVTRRLPVAILPPGADET